MTSSKPRAYLLQQFAVLHPSICFRFHTHVSSQSAMENHICTPSLLALGIRLKEVLAELCVSFTFVVHNVVRKKIPQEKNRY